MTFLNWVDRWLCCGKVDDESVVTLVRAVRQNPDALAEAQILYTHDPVEHHVSALSAAVVTLDNSCSALSSSPVQVVAATAAPSPAMGVAVPEEESSVSPTLMPVGLKSDKLYVMENVLEIMMGSVPLVLTKAVPVPFEYIPEPKSEVDSPVTDLVTVSEPAAMSSLVPADGPSSVYRVCQDVVEVKQHRRLPHKRSEKHLYAATVVSEVKNRLGCPAPTAANMLAVRRMAINSMSKHGLRPSHVREVLEVIVAGVFVPDVYDLEGAKMLASVATADLRAEVADAGPRSAWYDLFHPFKRRGAQRVRDEV